MIQKENEQRERNRLLQELRSGPSHDFENDKVLQGYSKPPHPLWVLPFGASRARFLDGQVGRMGQFQVMPVSVPTFDSFKQSSAAKHVRPKDSRSRRH